MLRILGDLCLADGYFDKGKGIGTQIAIGKDPFKYLYRTKEDYWIGNFECVCANGSDKPFVVSPDVLSSINHMDMYGFANNHAMQIGDDGYVQTVDYFKINKIPYFGSNAQRSYVFTHQNKRVGILGFCIRPDNFSDNPKYWHIPELKDIEDELKSLEKCDFIIAYVHWGYEFINYPNIEQRQMAHWLIDSGIDLVIGMHPHVTQGSEIYKGKQIYYSLGNAVFNMPWENTKHGLMVNVDLDHPNPKVWNEYLKLGEDGFPRIDKNVDKEFSIEYLNSIVNRQIENEKYFSEVSIWNDRYTKANRKAIIKRMMTMSFKDQVDLLKDFFIRRILKK